MTDQTEHKVRMERLKASVHRRIEEAQPIEEADLVTEMKQVEHPFRKGIKARPGVEF